MTLSGISSENFLAVALVINRSRDGPAFVFHYPPRVQAAPAAPDSTDLQDILLERLSQPANHDTYAPGNGGAEASRSKQWDTDEHIVTESGSQIVPWEHVAGFPARDLAGILSPARSYHKTLFQLSIEPLYCVSYPIHVPENGKWKKPKKAARAKATSQAEDPQSASHEVESANGKQPESSKDKDAKKEEVEEEKRSSMTMFNLVFILKPKGFDVRELVDTLYTHIVKKANRAYKYSQQHSDFIWKESKRILAAKDKAREDRE